eukprot:3354824-Pleurochrysis_carterae.AAC.1
MQPPSTGAGCRTAAPVRLPHPSALPIQALGPWLRGDGGWVDHGSRPLARWLRHRVHALTTLLQCHVPSSVDG